MDTLDLSIGVIDQSIRAPTSTKGVERLSKYRMYGGPLGNNELRAILAADIGAETETVALTAGASMALTATFASLRSKGKVLLPSPGFPGYFKVCRALGLAFETYDVPLTQAPFSAIKSAIERCPTAGCIVVNSPGNPLGTILSAHEIRTLISLACAVGTMPIIDQTYHDLIFEHPDEVEPKTRLDDSVQIFSLSKAPRLAGARLGYITAEHDLLADIMSTHAGLTLGVSQPSEQIALQHYKTQRDQTFSWERNFLLTARDLALNILEGSGVQTSYPKASPVLWIELPFAKISGNKLSQRIEHKLGISVASGEDFGVTDRAAIRCCFALKRDVAEHAFAGIAHVCQKELKRVRTHKRSLI